MAAVLPPDAMQVAYALAICNLDVFAINVLITIEGFNNMEALRNLETDDDVTQMANRLSRRPAGAPGGTIILGVVQIQNVKALAWWVRERTKVNLPLAPNLFNAGALQGAKERKKIEADRPKDAAISIADLGEFKADDYDVFEDAFLNFLSQRRGVVGESLLYVVRPAIGPAVYNSEEEMRRYRLNLFGPAFDQDNTQVYRLLKSFLVKTEGYVWIEPYNINENGREAFLAWTGHYNGDGEFNKRAHKAEERIKQLHFKSEQAFSFEKYASALNKCFTVLNKNERTAKTQYQMVDILMNGISASSSVEFTAAKSIARLNHREDFVGACNYLSEQASITFKGTTNEKTGFGRKRLISGTESDRGRGRGRFGGRGGRGRFNSRGGGRDGRGSGRGHSAGITINGIDVSDVNRKFTPQEWDKINTTPGGARYIYQQREFLNGRGRNGGGRGRQGGRNVAAVNTAGEEKETEPTTKETGDKGHQHGSGFGRGAYGKGGRGGNR
jgi:hypothetical protein